MDRTTAAEAVAAEVREMYPEGEVDGAVGLGALVCYLPRMPLTTFVPA